MKYRQQNCAGGYSITGEILLGGAGYNFSEVKFCRYAGTGCGSCFLIILLSIIKIIFQVFVVFSRSPFRMLTLKSIRICTPQNRALRVFEYSRRVLFESISPVSGVGPCGGLAGGFAGGSSGFSRETYIGTTVPFSLGHGVHARRKINKI